MKCKTAHSNKSKSLSSNSSGSNGCKLATYSITGGILNRERLTAGPKHSVESKGYSDKI
jgi:hypothetical protein